MKRMGWIVIAVSMCFVILVDMAQAEFRALLVGIDYRKAPNPHLRLSGARNDVREMHKVMTGTLGFSESSIKMLVEEDATRQNILKTFTHWLIEGTAPGDTVFFMYSGHGGQLEIPAEMLGELEALLQLPVDDPVKLQAEKRKYLEYFIPYDSLIYQREAEAAIPILDVEFYSLLQRLQGRKVHLFLDSCFSEGATRDPGAMPTGKARYVELPWNLWQQQERIALETLQSIVKTPSQRWKLPGPEQTQSWNPDYTLFAAARYFQLAYDLGSNGALTLPVLRLLRKNPGASLTNRDVLTAVRRFLHQEKGIPSATQESVFFGPAGAFDDPFVLTAPRRQTVSPPPLPEPGSDFETVIAQLTRLEHPVAPLTVDLWLDEPGKTHFRSSDRVTLYYRVNDLPQGATAYLTLLNVAPDGTLTILYPPPPDFAQTAGERLYLNAEVQAGKIHSIPKTRADLQADQFVGIDGRIWLAEGEEYFKAIVTAEPVDWNALQLETYQSRFTGPQAKGVAGIFPDVLQGIRFWGAGALRVKVIQ